MNTEQQNNQPNTDDMITYMPHNLYDAGQNQQQNTSDNFGPNKIQNKVHNVSPNKPQQYPNPGLAEREIQEILSSSGMTNGVITDGIKLASAISDIIVKNNQLLIQAIQSGNLNQKAYDDQDGSHQTAQPTQMWEAGLRPQSGMPAPDTQTNNPYSKQSGQNQQNQQTQ